MVHFRGFQPAVDEAVDSQARGRTLDVTSAARPLAAALHEHEGESPVEHAEHSDETPEEPAADPHFWLDPQRYADVANAIGAELARVDPLMPTGTAPERPTSPQGWRPSTASSPRVSRTAAAVSS